MNRQIDKLMMYRFWTGTGITLILMALSGMIVYTLTSEIPAEKLIKAVALIPEWTREHLRPERKENHAFLWCVATLPLWGLAAYAIVIRLKKVNPVIYWGMAFGVAAWSVFVCCRSPLFMELLFKPLGGVGAAWAILTAGLFVWLLLRRVNYLNKWIWFVLGMALVLLQIYTTRIYFPEYVNYVDRGHFGVLTQTISIAASGVFAPSQYGFYAYFLYPFWAVFGGSAVKVSLVMGLLFFIETGALLWLLTMETRNKWLVFAAAAALTLVSGSVISLHMGDFDPYFQYHPIRSFWPCLLLLAVYLVAGSKKKPLKGAAVTGLAAGTALLWNLDSGLVVCLASLGWFGWNAFCRRQRDWYLALGGNAGGIAVSVLFWYGVFSLWNGAPVSLSGSTEHQRVFYMIGYYMLPIPSLFNIWTLVALVYVVALLAGVWLVYRRPDDLRGQIYLLAGMLGIGLFVYYQGRSSDGNLINVSYLAFIIMVLFIDSMSAMIRSTRRTPLILPWLTMVGVLGMLAGTYICNLPVNAKLVGQITGRISDRKPEYYEDFKFIQEHAPADKIANIIGAGQGFYSIETGLCPGFLPFNYMEMITVPDFEYLLENLVVSQRPLFVTARKFVYDWEPPEQYFNQFFELKAVSPSGKVRYYLPKPLNQ